MDLPSEKENYTFADALTWGENEHIEIICGEAYMMSPPGRRHQEILLELSRQLSNFLLDKTCKVYAAPFAVRPFAKKEDAPEDEDTLLEPDITVVCDPEKLDDFGCKGAPDMVIEILSPSTRRHDLSVKYRLYQRAGVREYWIVDPEGKTVQVHKLEEGLYNAAEVYTRGAVPVGLWEGFSIDLDRVFAE